MTLHEQEDLKDLLLDLEQYFDNRQDIVDGESGPRPNEAMQYLQRVERCLAVIAKDTEP